jgi:hypothetical protein
MLDFQQVTGTDELLLARKCWVSGAEGTHQFFLEWRVTPASTSAEGKQTRRNKEAGNQNLEIKYMTVNKFVELLRNDI